MAVTAGSAPRVPKPSVPTRRPAVTRNTGTFRRKLAAKPVQPRTPDPDGGAGAVAPADNSFIDPGAPSTIRTSSVTDPKAAAASVAAQTAQAAEFDALRTRALETQLDAIAAQYGMTKEQLMADETLAGQEFRQATAGLMRQVDEANAASRNSLVDRGILRSGITLADARRIETGQAEQQAALDSDNKFRLAQIEAQRAALAPQEAAAVAAAKTASARTDLDLETMRALAGQA